MKKDFLFALFSLIGLTIGAGIFAIPFAISKSGIFPGIFYFLILGTIVLLLHLFFGEIVLRTKERHRLAGFAKKYLGEKAKNLIALTTIFGVLGVLLAYLILGGNFLEIIFSPFFKFSANSFSVLFWFFLSVFIFLGIRFIAPFQVLTNSFFILIFLVIFSLSFSKFDIEKIPSFSLPNFFLPYGIILFSFFALEAIPEASDILKEKRKLKSAIILSALIVGLIYFLFALSVVGASGKNTSQEALEGLKTILGEKIIILGALAALITIADSFLILAICLKNTLFYDFKIPKNFSSFFVSLFPLILFLSGLKDFIKVIGAVGTFLGLINGLAIVLIYKKAKKFGDREPEYSLNLPNFVFYLLVAILIFGTISQIYYEIHR